MTPNGPRWRCQPVPLPSDRPLLDHLVGGDKEVLWDDEAECLGDLEIDDQLELGGLYDGQLGRLLALENPADVDAGLAIAIGNACTVAHQATGNDVFAI
jgi:hypothetical protein